MSFKDKAIKFNKMKIGCIIMVLGFVRVNTLQFQRIKSGDTWGNQTCRNGTYVVRQAGEVDCMKRMEQADCNWNFDSPDPDPIGFIPNEPSNMITFKVRLLKKNRPSTNVTCANHTAGNIAVQNVNMNKSVWDTDIGNDIIRKTLTYQFNQTDGTVIIGFTKHWDGFLLKIFINCLDESGRNIAAHSTTRCVVVKYQGNVKYPINGLSPLKTTSSTFFTQATFGTEITITPAPPSTSTSTTTAPSTTELTKALAPTLTDISTTLNMATTQPLPLITTAAVPQTYTAASTTEATKRTPTTPTDISAATSMVTTRPSSTKTAAAPPKKTAASTTEATKPTPTTLTDISAATNMATTTPSLTTTAAAPPTNTAALTTKATKPTATTPTGISTASTMATTPPLSLSATTAASTTEATKSLAPPPSPTKETATTKAPNVGSVGDNNKDEDTLVLVIAIVGGVVALLPIIIFLLLIWYKRKKTRKYETGKSEQEMNGLSHPAYDADGDVLHSTRVFNEDQACEEVETCHDEMSEYAVVNKTTEASTNNGMIVIETKNPPDEQDMFSDAINK